MTCLEKYDEGDAICILFFMGEIATKSRQYAMMYLKSCLIELKSL